MDKRKIALIMVVSMLAASPLYGCQNNITDKDKEEAEQQQATYSSPFIYYPNTFFRGYSVNNGVRSDVDFFGWHSWTNSSAGVTSPYTSSSTSVKGTKGGVTTIGSSSSESSHYSGVHAGSSAG